MDSTKYPLSLLSRPDALSPRHTQYTQHTNTIKLTKINAERKDYLHTLKENMTQVKDYCSKKGKNKLLTLTNSSITGPKPE